MAAGGKVFANPRNAAAGSLAPARRRDHRVAAAAVFAYAWGEMSELPGTRRRHGCAAGSVGLSDQSADEAL
jgi:DNA ligase (NAD+)